MSTFFSTKNGLCSLLLLACVMCRAEAGMDISADTFGCIRDMTPVKGFYVSNLVSDVQATVKVAQSKQGGVYPVGSVVQLVPSEVMVKREAGFSPATGDWEFFELAVAAENTKITARGTTDVVNRFGGNCLGCHAKAEPKWDFICEQSHGCDPIPLTANMIRAIQKTDPRCTPVALSKEEVESLKALKASMSPAATDQQKK